jgi:hypothetical protein
MLKTVKLTTLDEGIIADIDVSVDQRTAILVSGREKVSLIVDGEPRRIWSSTEMPHLRRARWVFNNQVAVWAAQTTSVRADAVLVCSELEDYSLPIGTPHHIVGGKNVSYASYGEDQYLSAENDAIEANMVLSFDRYCKNVFGIKDLLRNNSWKNDPMEISAACVTDDDKLIISFYGCSGLWLMDSMNKTLTCIHGSSEIDQVSAMAERDGLILMSFVEAQTLRFSHFDIKAGLLTSDNDIEINNLFPKINIEQLHSNSVSTHGCPKGIIIAKSSDSAFAITLSE